MIDKVDCGKIATEENPRDLVFTKLELSPVVPESPVKELSLFPPISREPSETKDTTHQEGITWRKHKGCRCKQSKCLKLYCDCFASGAFCVDCDCADCHNNSDNCDVRNAAVVNVLEHNRNAFNEKPFISLSQYKAAYDTKLGVFSRGCKCQRSKCRKNYCECFQANVLCSENCKCINCKNVSEAIQPSVFAWGPNNRKLNEVFDTPEKKIEYENIVNALGIISPSGDSVSFSSHNTAGRMNNAPGFSAHNSPQVYQRRRHREPPEWSSCPAPLYSIPDNSILNALTSPMSSSPKLPYRRKKPSLKYTSTVVPDMGDISSLLVAASASATATAEDQNRINIQPDDKVDKPSTELLSEPESGNAEEEIKTCGKLIELIDAQYNGEEDSQCKTKTSVDETDLYMEQERAVLETFRECLQKFIKSRPNS